MAHCRVLGSIRVVDADGRVLTLVSEPQRRLLAILCLHGGSVVRSTVLEEHLGLSSGALRTSISRLRHVIGHELLVTGPAGYELNAEIDVVDYERFVSEAADSDAGPARVALERALSLWGNPYDEFAFEPWAEVEVRRLNDLHASAIEELVVLLLDAGDETAAVATLGSLIDEHPFRDLPRALLMRALSQLGRSTEALREFQAYRALLRDDVGTEPSAALVALDRAIVTGGDLEALREQGHPAWSRRRRGDPVAHPAGRRSLPTPISSFVGRVRETAEVAALLQEHRLLTLTGAGGSGKSRLALRAASALARGGATVWWIDLGVLAAGGDVAEQIAAEIGVLPRRGLVAELERRLHGTRSVLVLDNAEHVIDATADVVADLLTRCPDTRALVTSREPLGIPGEVVWRVPALGLPDGPGSVTLDTLSEYDAIRLFLTRAREARPGMAVDRQAADDIVSICIELDGMPLALELAAARLRTLPLRAVAQSIGEIIRWKGNVGRVPLTRHTTLRASIEWSFELISPSEQLMLLVLATFRSPFDTSAAVAVANSMGDFDGSADHIFRLADVGLLQLDDNSGWYRMLTTVRQFCLECGAARGVLARAEEAHARYFTTWCGDVGEGRMGLEHRPFVRRMPDVVAAMSWARVHDHEAAFRMCRGLAPVRSVLGQLADFDTTWRWLTGRDPDQRGPLWIEAVAGLLATATSLVLDTAPVEAALLERLTDGPGRARSWLERGRAMVPAYCGRPAQIVSYADGLLARGDDLESSVYVGFAAYMLALMGRLDECDRLLDQLRRLTRRHDAVFSVDSVGNGYAAAIVSEMLRGDLGPALDRGRRPVPTDPAFSMTSAAALTHAALLATDADAMRRAIEWSTLGSLPVLGYLTPFTSGCAALLEGRFADAADLVEESWEQAVRVPVFRVFALPVVVTALVGFDRPHVAERVVEVASGLMIDMERAPFLTVSVQLANAQIALARNDLDVAQRQAAAALGAARADQLHLAIVDAIDLLAVVAERRSDDVAAPLRDAAASERQRLGYRYRLMTAGLGAPGASRAEQSDLATVIARVLARPA